MSGPTCIVCGKQIAKRTRSCHIRNASAEHPHGDRRDEGWSVDLWLDEDKRPRSKTECAPYTNGTVLSTSKGRGGVVFSFNVWDGGYVDPHFCTLKCAAQQGRASAEHGARFTWNRG